MTPNQQLLVDAINKNDMVFAVGCRVQGKTYTIGYGYQGFKKKQVKRIILTRPSS
jgi:phosphate starvation-inducible PhoH-like protein